MGRLVVSLLSLGVAAALAPHRTAGQEPERERREQRERREARAPRTDVLGPELAGRLRSGRLDDVEIDVRWPHGDEVLMPCRVVGNGVGVWKRQSQFRLSRQEVRALLKTVQDGRFGTLPMETGEEESGEREQKGRVTVSVGPLSKTVVQLAEGTTPPGLQRIADAVLDRCAARGPGGVRVSGFDDAWSKLSSGTLAPETLEIRVQRRTDHPGEGPAEDWFLRVNGRRLSDRDRPPGAARASSRELLLSPKEHAELVAKLRESDLPTIPLNVYAPQYTDVRIQVLDQLRHFQARPFTGMTPATHGEKQSVFDRLFEMLAALHRRVVAEGRVVREPEAAPAASRRELD